MFSGRTRTARLRGFVLAAMSAALAGCVDAMRRSLLTAEPLPRELATSADLSSLRYPGLSTVVLPPSGLTRSGLAALAAAGNHLVFADQLHAVADEFGRQRPLGDVNDHTVANLQVLQRGRLAAALECRGT